MNYIDTVVPGKGEAQTKVDKCPSCGEQLPHPCCVPLSHRLAVFGTPPLKVPRYSEQFVVDF